MVKDSVGMAPRNAETSQALSVEDLRLMGEAIDASPSPFTLYDQNFQIIYANRASRDIWPELHRVLASGAGLEAAAIAESQAIFKGAPDATIRKAANYVIEQFNSTAPHDMMTASGQWMKVTHNKILDRAIVGVGSNISDLKKRESQLERAQKAQSDLIEVLGHAVLVVDENGVITMFNTAYREYCRSVGFDVEVGMTEKEVTWKFIEREQFNVPKAGFDEWFEGFYKKRFNNEIAREEEFSLRDGRHILRHQQYVKNVGNVITFTDITDIKNAQLRAEAAERSKSEFLANMSHEIRTPMNGVLGMAHLLKRCDLGQNELQLVELIERSGQALMTVINDILDFSRIEAGQVVLDEETFNIRHCATDVAALLMMAAAEKDVELQVNIQPDLPLDYIGDGGRLRQVITNILGNAVKFTEAGYVRLDISGKRRKSHFDLLISIKDSGIGIPTEMMDKIFNKFQQADGSTTRKFEGTGLGLSIAKRLVELMEGDIMVDSQLGNGSRFDIRLPLRPVKSIFENKKILIIKDNTIACEALGNAYKDRGARVVPVCSLRRAFMALDIAKREHMTFDYVLMDVEMTVVEETALAVAIRDLPDFGQVPIYLPETSENYVRAQRLKEHGLTAELVRQFSPETLREVLMTAVPGKRAA